ncbi:hypothetical protein AC249_AIPGENE16323 [Exaiptasia diaphana]|nr:hypothetical protein AC249_AIPGENE16323 [Exaiptasia diaphana]
MAELLEDDDDDEMLGIQLPGFEINLPINYEAEMLVEKENRRLHLGVNVFKSKTDDRKGSRKQNWYANDF